MRAAIILAAGASRRFGRSDKLRARLGRHSLLDHVVANARSAVAGRILLVTARPARHRGVTSVRAGNARLGLAASLTAGLAALRPIEREVLIFLADMPFARAPHMKIPPGADAIRPRFRGEPGHPMLVRTTAARNGVGRGDRGLAYAVDATFVRGAIGNVIDIDTQKALRQARHGSCVRGARWPIA